MKRFAITLLLLTPLFISACAERHEGPMERAGEHIDDAVDNVREGKSPLHKKGTLERAGEDIDNTLNTRRDRD